MLANTGLGLIQEARTTTPTDTVDYNCMFPQDPRAGGRPANLIMVATAGPVSVRRHGGDPTVANEFTSVALLAGVWYDMPPFIHVLDTGTTATSVSVGIRA